MKKLICILAVIIAVVGISVIDVSAQDISCDLSGLYDSLSDEARQSLKNIGADSADADKLSKLSFSSIMQEIAGIASDNMQSPLRGLISLTALLLICSLISAYKNTVSTDVLSALNVTTALCITSAVALPAIGVIQKSANVISVSSNIMTAYLPIMVVIMATSGHVVSGSSYYSMMLVAGQGVAQLSSRVIVPMLNMFLGVSITSNAAPDINLNGFIQIFSKTVKWLLGFAMAVFTALLSVKQLITGSIDSVSTRALKFTLSSFIPIVGSALADAYNTVQGSVGILKSGVCVFVILSVAVVFLPVIIQTLMWIFTLWIGRATAQALGLSQPAGLIESISTVFSTILAILLCLMSIFIISTAVVLMAGRGE